MTIAMAMSISSATAAPKPLKIYILAGQSNMQGKAGVRTIERLNMTEDSKQMYMDMNVKNGLPSAPKDVYGVYFGGDDMSRKKARTLSVMRGPLRPGYEGEMTSKSTFGPEYTFGIYMQKHLNEPILIVKIAWGGRNLIEQFRPPSSGKYLTLNGEEKVMDGHGNPIGHYYSTVIKRVNEVLADPGKYHPAYKKADGYEIAGFVWFQGFNDLVGPYPYKDPKQGKKSGKDYSEYSRLLGLFIKDIRKDLKTPKMPFVIGVMGIGGELKPGDQQQFFREAMAAPASMEEFKGNVSAVRTGQFWDMKITILENRVSVAAEKAVLAKDPDAKKRIRAFQNAVQKMKKTLHKEVLTAEEQAFLKLAKASAGYHYNGSAYTYGKIGKAFADSMVTLQ